MGTELYSYSSTVDPHFLFKQRQFNIGILFIEGRDILHFADFLGVLHFVEKITYYKVNTERNQKMLFSKNNWVFIRKKNVHPHCLSHHPPEPPSFSLYTTFKVKL